MSFESKLAEMEESDNGIMTDSKLDPDYKAKDTALRKSSMDGLPPSPPNAGGVPLLNLAVSSQQPREDAQPSIRDKRPLSFVPVAGKSSLNTERTSIRESKSDASHFVEELSAPANTRSPYKTHAEVGEPKSAPLLASSLPSVSTMTPRKESGMPMVSSTSPIHRARRGSAVSPLACAHRRQAELSPRSPRSPRSNNMLPVGSPRALLSPRCAAATAAATTSPTARDSPSKFGVKLEKLSKPLSPRSSPRRAAESDDSVVVAGRPRRRSLLGVSKALPPLESLGSPMHSPSASTPKSPDPTKLALPASPLVATPTRPSFESPMARKSKLRPLAGA